MSKGKFNHFFYYPNTGQNINPLHRENVGKILPVEYLNSTIIPIRLVNKDNPKEICLLLATVDNFEEEDLTENDLSEEENSYNIQLIKHSKEMLEMLQYLNRRGGLGLDIHNKIEQLIKQATEL